MTDAVDWLPLTALITPRVTATLDAVVAEWGEAWFFGRRLRLGPASTARRLDAFAGQDEGWSVRKQSIGVSRPRGVASRLAEWSLDRKPDEFVATAADRELISRYEDRLTDDLVWRLLSVLGIDDIKPRRAPAAAGGLLTSVVDGDGAALLNLQIPVEALAPFIRRGASPRALGDKLEPLIAAANRTAVGLEASLGTVELSLRELQELAPGDVLVLDLGLDDPVELTLAQSGAVLARAKFTESEGRRALVVQN